MIHLEEEKGQIPQYLFQFYFALVYKMMKH